MFIIITKQIIKMGLLLFLGFFCYRKKLISHEGTLTLSNLLLMVITPALVLVSFQIDHNPRILKGMLAAMLLSILAHVIGIILSTLLVRKDPKGHYVIERFSDVMSNCGFMGIPLINALYGAEGVIYLTAYVTVFNILTWTYGYSLMTGTHSLKKMRGGLLSPVMISIVIGLAFFLLKIRLPRILYDTCSYLSDMNTPVAMLLAGAVLAESDLGSAVQNRGVYRVGLMRLVIIPLLTLLVFMLFPIDPMIRCTVLIAAACPTGTICIMFALRFNKDHVHASQIFALVTVASLITLPLFVLLCEKLI